MTFAQWLMKLARVAAPRDRNEWAHAMSAEFSALDRNANHIAWAAGCLGAALMWRLQGSALYLMALVGLSVLWNVLISGLIFDWSTGYAFAQPIGQREMGHLWMALSEAGREVTLLAMAAALSVYRPQYAAVTAIVLWVGTTGALFISTFGPSFAPLLLSAPFSSEGNNPAIPNVVMTLLFFGTDLWPVLVGSVLGWAFARGKHGAVAAGGVVALALVVAEYVINPGESPPVLSEFTLIADVAAASALIVLAIGASVVTAQNFRRAWRMAS